ncbi:MAG: TetR/AcrR family transcriptional regulator [Nannocystaceae bacterium]
MSTSDEGEDRGDVRARILDAAAALIAEGGAEAATTRAISAAAGVQAPTIYRLFGDKRGLLDAVAEHAMAGYVARKSARKPHPDPVEDLRRGWDDHVAFGLAQPGVFALMRGEPGVASPAARAGMEVLRLRIRRVAASGRLRVREDRAAALVHAVGTGIVQALLEQPEPDLGLSRLAREAVVAAITGESDAPRSAGIQGAALALRASLDDATGLSPGERLLLAELLARLASAGE